ncbi:MAG TPA: hypothetical protein VE978_19040 [Chitinophagales bacterium]|nr:hypothetical protein [Chitinophagales bacterium]
MGFFGKIFGGEKDNGPTPTRALNLQFSVTPENGERFAMLFQEAVQKNDNTELNYSVDTLDFVDNFLQRFKDEGLTVNDFAETIFVAGCYVGQVMINNNNGQWIQQEDAGLPTGITMMPLVVKLGEGRVADPITKAFKRFHNGEIDSVRYFYHVFTKVQ